MKVITFNPNVYKILCINSTKMHETPSQTVSNLIEFTYDAQQKKMKGEKTTDKFVPKKLKAKLPTTFPANSVTITDSTNTKLEKFAELAGDHPLAVASCLVLQDWLTCETYSLEETVSQIMYEVDNELGILPTKPSCNGKCSCEKTCEHEKKCKKIGKSCKKCDK